MKGKGEGFFPLFFIARTPLNLQGIAGMFIVPYHYGKDNTLYSGGIQKWNLTVSMTNIWTQLLLEWFITS